MKMYIEHNHPELLVFYDSMGDGRSTYFSNMKIGHGVFGIYDVHCFGKPLFYML